MPADINSFARKVIANVELAIVGKRPQILLALGTWLAEGHLLLEDVPGVAKTMLARALARSVGCSFKRVQCTPDLLPSDVTGASVFNQKTTEFEFRPGPLFAQVVLADEINRATPRTQAALLEAMAERNITVDGITHRLKPPFMVMATQNPIDHEGTFPLPEAQLDRFLMRFSLGYPAFDDELKMLEMLQRQHPIESLKPVVTAEELVACQDAVREVHVDDKVRRYILQIIHDTRTAEDLALGGSPRASIALFRSSQAIAALRNRNYVLPDDVKRCAAPVLAHRVILKPESRLRKITAEHVVNEVVGELAVPTLDVPPAAPGAGGRRGDRMMWYLAVIALLVVALVFRLGLLTYAMYVVLGVLILSRYLANEWAKGLSAERELSRHDAEVGDRVVVNITLKNTSWWLIPWVLVEDLLPREAVMYDPPKLWVDGRRVQLVMMSGGKTRHLNYSFICNRRGYFQVGPLTIETGDLFGLHRKYLLSAPPQFVLVLPKVVPLSGYNIASRRPIGEVRMSYRLYEDPTRISGVRPYEPGDPFNRVNWRATARTGVLHSKTYEPSTIAGATIVIDFHSAVHAAKDEPFRSELAVTAAASIANAVYLMGHQVGLVTNGRDAADRIRAEGYATDARTRDQIRQSAAVKEKSDRLQPIVVPARRGAEQLSRILETLARLELTDGLPLSSLLLETTSRLVRDATVIVILPRVTPEEAVALGMLKRQGFAVVALLNLYDEFDYATSAGPLLALGIETRHLRDEAAVAEICGKQQGVAFV